MPFGKKPATTTGYRSLTRPQSSDLEPMIDVALALAPSIATTPLTQSALQDDQRDSKLAAQRLIDFSETMFAFLGQTIEIADAIRTGGSIELKGWDVDLQPEVTPIDIRVLDDYFTLVEKGRTYHPTYGYALPESPTRPDDGAQLHLHQLTSRIVELNTFCQLAARDDALAVALQLPELPELVDRILVGTAHFTAYFQNLALIKAHAPSALSTIDFAPLLENVERRRLLANDKMLAPEKFEAYVPFGPWPCIGVETLTPSTTEARFPNKVYFPQDKQPTRVPIILPLARMAGA
jgi:hypothetical protein